MQVTDGQGNTATYGAGGSADLPSWVPAYPNGTASSNYSADTADGKTAMVSISTSDSVESVIDFYEQAFKDGGLKVQKSLMSEGGSPSGGTLSAESADGKQQAALVLGVTDGKTQVSLTWTEKP